MYLPPGSIVLTSEKSLFYCANSKLLEEMLKYTSTVLNNIVLTSEKSLFYCANSKFLEEMLKKVPDLSEPYVPTRFWGFSGHIQTIVQV